MAIFDRQNRKATAVAFDGAVRAPLPVSKDAPIYGAVFENPSGNCYTHALNLVDLMALDPGDVATLEDVTAVNGPNEESMTDFYSLTDPEYHQDYMKEYAAYLRKGARADGLIELKEEPPAFIPSGYYLIAMAVRCCLTIGDGKPEESHAKYPKGNHIREPDGHWYVQHGDGTWSQRRGIGGEITQLDDSGRIITDPRTADRGDYREFGGFFLAPTRLGR